MRRDYEDPNAPEGMWDNSAGVKPLTAAELDVYEARVRDYLEAQCNGHHDCPIPHSSFDILAKLARAGLKAAELYGPSPIDALQSAFIAGIDRVRELYVLHEESWPTLEERLALAEKWFPHEPRSPRSGRAEPNDQPGGKA